MAASSSTFLANNDDSRGDELDELNLRANLMYGLRIAEEKERNKNDEELQEFLNTMLKNVQTAAEMYPAKVSSHSKIVEYIGSKNAHSSAEEQYLDAASRELPLTKLERVWNIPQTLQNISYKGLVKSHPYLYCLEGQYLRLWKITDQNLLSYQLNTNVIAVHVLDLSAEVLMQLDIDLAVLAVTRLSVVVVGLDRKTNSLKKIEEYKLAGVSCVTCILDRVYVGCLSGHVHMLELGSKHSWSWSKFQLSLIGTECGPINVLTHSNDSKLVVVATANASSVSIYKWRKEHNIPLRIELGLDLAGCIEIYDILTLAGGDGSYVLSLACSGLRRYMCRIDANADNTSKVHITSTVKEPPQEIRHIFKVVSEPSGICLVQTSNQQIVLVTTGGLLDFNNSCDEAFGCLEINGVIRDFGVSVDATSGQAKLQITTDFVVVEYSLIDSKDQFVTALTDVDDGPLIQTVFEQMPENVIASYCIETVITDEGLVSTNQAVRIFTDERYCSIEAQLNAWFYQIFKITCTTQNIGLAFTLTGQTFETHFDVGMLQTVGNNLNALFNVLNSMLKSRKLRTSPELAKVLRFLNYAKEVTSFLQLMKCENLVLDANFNMENLLIPESDIYFKTFPSQVSLLVAGNMTKSSTYDSFNTFITKLTQNCPQVFNDKKAAAVLGNYCLKESMKESVDFGRKSKFLHRAQQNFERACANSVNRSEMCKDLISLGGYRSMAQIMTKFLKNNSNVPFMRDTLWAELESVVIALQSEREVYLVLHVIMQEGNLYMKQKIYSMLFNTGRLVELEKVSLQSYLQGFEQFLRSKVNNDEHSLPADADVLVKAVISFHRLLARSKDEKQHKEALKILVDAATSARKCSLIVRKTYFEHAIQYAQENQTSRDRLQNLKFQSKLLSTQLLLLEEAKHLGLPSSDTDLTRLVQYLEKTPNILMQLATKLSLPKSMLRVMLVTKQTCDLRTCNLAWDIIVKILANKKFEEAKSYLEEFGLEFFKYRNCFNLKAAIYKLEEMCANQGGIHSTVADMLLKVSGMYLCSKTYLECLVETNCWTPTTEGLVKSSLHLAEIINHTGEYQPYSKKLLQECMALLHKLHVPSNNRLHFLLAAMQGRPLKT